MKKKRKKLTLHRESLIQLLREPNLQPVVGGVTLRTCPTTPQDVTCDRSCGALCTEVC